MSIVQGVIFMHPAGAGLNEVPRSTGNELALRTLYSFYCLCACRLLPLLQVVNNISVLATFRPAIKKENVLVCPWTKLFP